ncbi:hypothetical protein Droror1_Dr00002829 [Drosera rotundifolia]
MSDQQRDPYNLKSDDSILDSDSESEVTSSRSPSEFSSATHRALPDWPLSTVVDSDFGDYGSRYASSSSSYHPHRGGHSFPNYGSDARASTSSLHLNDDFSYSSQKVYEDHLTKQSERRTLPPTITQNRDNNYRYNGERSRSHNTLKAQDSAGPSRPYSISPDDDVVMYDSSGRILPPPSMRASLALPATNKISVDPLFHAAMAEGSKGDDERLIYQAALQDLSQPKSEANVPHGLLSVPLLRHQKIALQWMLQKETKSLHCLGGILADDQGLGKTISMIALIQMQKLRGLKSKSEHQYNRKAEALILDDDDDDDTGRGGKENVEKNGEPEIVKCRQAVSTSGQPAHKTRPAAGTLVVCPATVLRQWARELDDKSGKETKLSVLVYHGGSRPKDPAEIAKYDVVLTTYAIVTNEVPKQSLIDEDGVEIKAAEEYGISSGFPADRKRKNPSKNNKKANKVHKEIDNFSGYSGRGPLGRVNWLRVVLDEAQTIKNHRTLVARACSGLRAKTRWCLSGTPIQNAIDELFSYFRFLKYDPYGKYKSFVEGVKLPISKNPEQGFRKLQAVLRAVMLRRTKDTLLDGLPIISLPPKSVELKRVEFTAEERSFYSKLETESRIRFKEYAAAGTVSQNYASILLMLLRLRQACDHPLLVKGFNPNSARRTSVQMAKKLSRRLLLELLHRLGTSSTICRLCSDPPEDAVVTKCGHIFCYQCVADYLSGDNNTCPGLRCKKHLSDDVIFSSTTLRSCLSDDAGTPNGDLPDRSSLMMSNAYSSSKIRAALEILQSHAKSRTKFVDLDDSDGSDEDFMETELQPRKRSSSELPIKTIVFSQWTGMLDLFEISLNQSLIQYRRLDGGMSLAARDKAVREFNSNPKVSVMLMSLKAGNLGLNMVAACEVILLDLWWNPATEDQAVDRAHRIGQTRPVKVSRLTIKDTVEDRILAMQEEKRKMVASAFGEDKGGGNSGPRLTIEDLKCLFNMPG